MRDRSTVKTADIAADDPVSYQVLKDLEARFRGPPKSYFAKRDPNPSDIDDLVQDVFVKLAARSDISKIERIEG